MNIAKWLDQIIAQNPKSYSVAIMAFGAFVAHVWNRFRNRTITLTWTVSHQQHAVSSELDAIGKIEVLVNGSRARCLYLTTVELRNPTVKDVEDIEVEFELPVGSTIVASEGGISGQVRLQHWGKSFSADADRAKEIWKEETTEAKSLRDKVSRWRTYALPAFNRQSVATFWFLWENAQNINPIVNVSAVHLGVKLAYREVPQLKVLGIDNRHAALAGVLLAAILGLALFTGPREWLILVLGLVAAIVGALVIRAWQFVVRMMS